MIGVRSVRGGAFFLVARLAAKLIVARDGTVTGENFHLTENRLIPEARLIWS